MAQFKFTVFVHSKGPERITFVDFDPSLYSSQHSITDEAINVSKIVSDILVMFLFRRLTLFFVFNCSQTKFVAIILVLLVFCM